MNEVVCNDVTGRKYVDAQTGPRGNVGQDLKPYKDIRI